MTDDEAAPFWTHTLRRRLAVAAMVLLAVVLLLVVPPLISVTRYQRRVATAMSDALGRPVHFDTIALHLLPLPGLTIGNFVVGETPDFGYEPVMRANTVEARLRLGSLWRRRIEVSRISLESPSINLVRNTATGRWNLQRIVNQAAQLTSAPTAQAQAGEAPRFPYIEATDARLNIKNGEDKLPFSLTEAEFALWLPQPDQWQLRLSGKPMRTDTDVSDVGIVRLDATLGRASDLTLAPIHLEASWKPTQLGEAAKLTAGRDLGWRGTISADALLTGTIGAGKLTTNLHLLSLHRADFQPENTAQINLHCEGDTAGLLRSLLDVRCAVPTSEDTSLLAAIDFLRRAPALTVGGPGDDVPTKPGVLFLRANIPDTFSFGQATLHASLGGASPNYALAWMRLFSRRIPATLGLGGSLGLTAWKEDSGAGNSRWGGTLVCTCVLPALTGTADRPAEPARWNLALTDVGVGTNRMLQDTSLVLTAYPASAGDTGEKPVADVSRIAEANGAGGTLSRDGLSVTFASPAIARQAAAILPPLGDGLPADEPSTARLLLQRPWSGTPVWTSQAAASPRKVSPRRR